MAVARGGMYCGGIRILLSLHGRDDIRIVGDHVDRRAGEFSHDTFEE